MPPTKLDRARLIDGAMKEVEKEEAFRKTAFGLRNKGLKRVVESSQRLRELAVRSLVIAYRSVSRYCGYSFKIYQIETNTVFVQTSRVEKYFVLHM